MIRFANINDVDNIMEFIDTYWKKGHIMGNNKVLFMFQHNMCPEELSFVINEEENKEINGVLGYIPYGKKNRDIMLALWKVNHTADPMLGIRMLQYLISNSDARNVSCPGVNKKVRGIYEYLGYFTDEMKHWYRLRGKEEYRIAQIVNPCIPLINIYEDVKLIKVNTFDELETYFEIKNRQPQPFVPYKEDWYIKKRYFEHPMNKYNVYCVQNKESIGMVLVTSIVEYNGSRVMRVIDCIGDFKQITYITSELDTLLCEYDAEYIDFYVAGLPDILFYQSGWLNVKETENIIPEHFSPFENKNIDIYYFSTEKNIVLFKGDGDQDRPN